MAKTSPSRLRPAARRARVQRTSSSSGTSSFRPILTERTEKALRLANMLASRNSARVTLLHVIEALDGLSFKELKPFYERLERKARTTMNELIRRAPERSASAAGAVVYGRRAEDIVKFAAANGVDLIVLASHRVNPSRVNRDWGTISYKVGILAQCPVLLVK